MNILIVSQYFWPESFRINDFAVSLHDRGHHVSVLTGIPNYPEGCYYPGYGIFKRKSENYRGVNVIRVSLISRGRNSLVRLAFNYLSFAFNSSVMAPFRCRDKYDCIMVYGLVPIFMAFPALFLKKLRKIPVILWVQDLWPEGLYATGAVRSKFILELVGRIVRFVYRRCDKILVQSKAFIAPIRKMGISEDRIIYFPNSAEELFKPINSKDDEFKVNDLPDGFRVMFAGNVGLAQNISCILSAAERIQDNKDIKWIVIGDGRQYDWLKGEVRERGLDESVFVLGRRPLESMPHYFSRADAMLVTLVDNPTISLTIPSKIQSYMACGKPIIASLDGEGSRVIDEAGAGITCKAGDSKELAKAVLSMYALSKLDRQAMGDRGRVYYRRNYDRELLLSKFDDITKNMISNK